MYRVLIADDEPSVTESLEKYIEWKELGLEVAGIVENGREVLDFLDVAVLIEDVSAFAALDGKRHTDVVAI